jgi:hypothetical protein
MVEYMLARDNGSRILVVVSNANTAAPLILDYGISVIAIGGFSGGDNTVSLEDFIALVRAATSSSTGRTAAAGPRSPSGSGKTASASTRPNGAATARLRPFTPSPARCTTSPASKKTERPYQRTKDMPFGISFLFMIIP